MAVKICIENREWTDHGFPLESCILCNIPTATWWGDGCTPLCDICAELTTHEDMVEISIDTGHGPLPNEDTTQY